MLSARLFHGLPLWPLLLAGQTFDAASVKPAEQQSGFLAPVRAGNAGRVTYRNYNLRLLLAEAYGVSEYQVIGPAWLPRERYDIVATRPRGSGPDAIPAMLRALLTERFHLQSHREIRTMQSWALLPDKDTSKLRPAKNVGEVAGCNSWGDLAGFAGLLAKVLERPVVDETGIAGSFFYILYIVPGLSAPPPGGVTLPPPPAAPPPCPGWSAATMPAPASDVFEAVRNQMGLRLEKRAVEPVRVVVIDKADRVPEKN
jgi:uncharacterized protein (TIGR03435 family)